MLNALFWEGRHPPAVHELCKCLQSALEMSRRLFFAEVLAENNRLNLVPKIAETFEDIIASARGQVKAIITTAEVSTAVCSCNVVAFGEARLPHIRRIDVLTYASALSSGKPNSVVL